MKPSRERDNAAYLTTLLARQYGRRLQPFFQGTVTNVEGTGPYSVQVQRTGEAKADGNIYLCASPGYAPAIGDVVECVWRDDHTGYVLLPLPTTSSSSNTWRGSAKPRVLVASGILSGPLPVSQAFTPAFPDSTFLIQASGTIYVTGIGVPWINVNLDGSQVATTSMFFNNTNVHATVPTVVVTVSNLSSVSHTVQLSAGTGALSDGNDRFSILVTEFPA